ncbi:MAG TPA: VOC family protein, partial [Steroidobacter sp.]|nr:VOC family protein [Steroidobacter sp.]
RRELRRTPGPQLSQRPRLMHKSRLAGFIIDCKTDNLEKAAEFWSAALGWPLKPRDQEPERTYRQLMTGEGGLHIEVQQVDHQSRVHLDIEADDLEAEVRRLESLGARVVSWVHRWCVMEAPTGQRFCVVRVQRAGFEEGANVWE